MRISDWSSDVCSSDLRIGACLRLCHIAAERSYIEDAAAIGNELAVPDCGSGMEHPRAVAFGRIDSADRAALVGCPIGRASGRESGCQSVSLSVAAGSYKKQTNDPLTGHNTPHI